MRSWPRGGISGSCRDNLKDYRDRLDEWYRGPEGIRIAANVLSYQSETGSWPKNLDTTARPYEGDRRTLKGTFDNGATFGELRFLARSYRATRSAHCRDAVPKGLDHVIAAQHPTEGWPQCFPPGAGYPRYITFVAGAHWFERSRIDGIRQTRVGGDKVIARDDDAEPLWARFYEIPTNRPIFCGRDGVIRYDIAEIERERRNGYAWYGGWGVDVASRYARWKKRWNRERISIP